LKNTLAKRWFGTANIINTKMSGVIFLVHDCRFVPRFQSGLPRCNGSISKTAVLQIKMETYTIEIRKSFWSAFGELNDGNLISAGAHESKRIQLRQEQGHTGAARAATTAARTRRMGESCMIGFGKMHKGCLAKKSWLSVPHFMQPRTRSHEDVMMSYTVLLPLRW